MSVVVHPLKMTVVFVMAATLMILDVVVLKMAHQAVIMPVVQLLLMMNVVYVMVTTHPVLTVLAYQMVILL